eukprot:SAG31_NODE_4544_length_3150_cov_1.620125_2_plen_118_part_00
MCGEHVHLSECRTVANSIDSHSPWHSAAVGVVMRAGRHYAEFMPILRDRYGSINPDFADGGIWLGVAASSFDPSSGTAAIHAHEVGKPCAALIAINLSALLTTRLLAWWLSYRMVLL